MDLLLQTLGWISVVWLIAVDVLTRRGMLPPGGRGYRIAGCAAALCVVAASVSERIWPVAVLGLLWLRTEVFRHHSREWEAEQEPEVRFVPAPVGVRVSGADDEEEPVRRPHLRLPHPHLPQVHLPHPHRPHLPRMSQRFVSVAFRVEMAVVIVIASVLFFLWAEQQRDAFRPRTDGVLCNWIPERCTGLGPADSPVGTIG